MSKENISQKFRLKNIDETRTYFISFILFHLVSIVTGCVSISAFLSLVRIPVETRSFAIVSKVCAITAGIENYKSLIKKNKKNHDKIVLLAEKYVK